MYQSVKERLLKHLGWLVMRQPSELERSRPWLVIIELLFLLIISALISYEYSGSFITVAFLVALYVFAVALYVVPCHRRRVIMGLRVAASLLFLGLGVSIFLSTSHEVVLLAAVAWSMGNYVKNRLSARRTRSLV